MAEKLPLTHIQVYTTHVFSRRLMLKTGTMCEMESKMIPNWSSFDPLRLMLKTGTTCAKESKIARIIQKWCSHRLSKVYRYEFVKTNLEVIQGLIAYMYVCSALMN